MQNILKKKTERNNNDFLLLEHEIYCLSENKAEVYFSHLNKIINENKRLIDRIIKNYRTPLTFPMSVAPLELYLSGYVLEYISFDNSSVGSPDCDGYRKSDFRQGLLQVHYNTNCSEKRQRFTIIHELIHYCQQLDGEFIKYMNDLLLDTVLPFEITLQLIEKSADKATAIYLMPNKFFIKKYEEKSNVKELSEYFQVSKQGIIYRLKECGIFTQKNNPAVTGMF